MITVVGLGTRRGEATLAAMDAMRAADEVLVRTAAPALTQTLEEHGIAYSTLDFLYETSRSYDTLTKKLVAEVRRRGKGRSVCYCVDGATYEDRAARVLIERGAKAVEGVSKASALASLCGFSSYTALSAFELGSAKIGFPLVVYDVTDDSLGDLKLLLSEKIGDEAEVVKIVNGVGKTCPLYEIDRGGKLEGLCGIAVKEVPLLGKKRFDFEDFVAILRRLRAPDGCPWDRVQTHESIRINAIEEAYELVDAIDRDDPERMCEEAGDVLMQAVFHALIEEERGGFTVGDMLTGVSEKLITRHTHVFGKDKAAGAEGALAVWDRNKMTEKHQETFSDAVNDVPECFPALLRAQKIAKRVEKGGWNRPTFEEFEKKFREEYIELRAACREGDEAHIREELGDVLFAAVGLGRACGADCEQALLDTVKKVQARYTAYEALVRADGKDVLALSEEEKNAYYARAKHGG